MEYMRPEEMRALELNTAYLGITLLTLMENAGRGAYEEIKRRFEIKDKKIVVLCGTGNNGGDGFVLSRQLSQHAHVEVILLGDPNRIIKYEAKTNWEIIKNLGLKIKIHIIKNKNDLRKIKRLIKESDIIIDAILGTGVKGKLREPISTAIDLINNAGKTVISIDIPTGLDPSTGEVLDKAIKPKLTITFHKPKTGLKNTVIPIGELVVVPISIPTEAEIIVGPGDVATAIKQRTIDNKKGDFGKLLIIGGSDKYHGAPIFSALAAIRTGVDLVILAAPEYLSNTLRSFSPDLIVRSYPGKALNRTSIPFILDLIEWADAIIVGPGLGVEKETKEAILDIFQKISDIKKPVVVDADAIKALALNKSILKHTPAVVTPHRGEFKLLTGLNLKSSHQIKDMLPLIMKEIKEFGITFVIKGAIDLIVDENKYKLNLTGNPGMTVGGTGDVLTGIIGCLLAQKNSPFIAGSAGAFINGLAGDILLNKIGFHLTASKLLEYIPTAIEKALSFLEAGDLKFSKSKLL
ncbi:MAG: NAD(P)H-hydrate dehydratase [Candidatus Odinarchaeia archaeon]